MGCRLAAPASSPGSFALGFLVFGAAIVGGIAFIGGAQGDDGKTAFGIGLLASGIIYGSLMMAFAKIGDILADIREALRPGEYRS